MIKRAAVVNDLSGFGRCSLTAAISVLSAMGIQACPLPTAVLTAQTGFPSYYCDDCTDRIPHFIREWSAMNVRFDGIYTGFMTGERQIAAVSDFLDRFYDGKNCLLVDPILGDNGRSYDIYSDSLCDGFRRLAARADIVTPNVTELCFLTGGRFEELSGKDQDASFRRIADMGSSLLNKKGKAVVVTGILCHDAEDGTERIGNMCVTEDGNEMIDFSYQHGSYSGTGDLFASALTGGILRGDSIQDTIRLAGRFLEKSLADSAADKTPPNEGVNYEQYLGMLMRKHENEE